MGHGLPQHVVKRAQGGPTNSTTSPRCVARAITRKRAGHIAAKPGVNRADDRAMANLRAAARRRPPPFPDVRLDDLSAWLRRRVSAHVIAMLKERDTRGLPLTDD